MSTLLVGYDVEAFAIGEGLARIGDHGFVEALDPDVREVYLTNALEVMALSYARRELRT